MDELAGGPEQLLGGERELLDGPAVNVAVAHAARGRGQRRGEEQWRAEARVVEGEHDKGRTVGVGVGVGAPEVGPDFRPQEERVFAPRLDASWRGGGHGVALVGPRQRPDHGPARWGAPTPVLGGRHRPPEGGVLGEAHHVTRGPGRVEERQTEARIEHQHVVGHALPHRLTHQQARVGAGRRVDVVRAHQGQRQREALGAEAADPRDEPDRDGGQGVPGCPMVVRRRAGGHAWSPKPGHIHGDRMIATMGMRLPLAFPGNQRGPVAAQLRARPVTPPHRPCRQPAVRQPRKDGPARREESPTRHHPPQVEQAQIGAAGQRAHQRTQERQHPVHCFGQRGPPRVAHGLSTRTLPKVAPRCLQLAKTRSQWFGH